MATDAASTASSGHEPLAANTVDATRDGDSKQRGWAITALHYLLDQWFLIALGILILIASQAQVPTRQQSLKETVISYLCVSIIFLITGLTLDTRALIDNYARWQLHLFVQIQCFLMTSAVIVE
ncbi:MAG: hypothetical protein M1828_002007 [Chrysothrix sp. TS-e1954]|nr:MAG: hypothetical protein M1828_002007 [Chrysothrix sp. TS-e1954]